MDGKSLTAFGGRMMRDLHRRSALPASDTSQASPRPESSADTLFRTSPRPRASMNMIGQLFVSLPVFIHMWVLWLLFIHIFVGVVTRAHLNVCLWALPCLFMHLWVWTFIWCGWYITSLQPAIRYCVCLLMGVAVYSVSSGAVAYTESESRFYGFGNIWSHLIYGVFTGQM